jgi:hypothetical protein
LEPMTSSLGGFSPVGTVLQRQLATPTPPARRALPAPADRPAASAASSKAWQPSQELRETEERIKAMFAKPDDGKKI